MVGLTEIADPGNGIGNGFIQGAVLAVKLPVGLATAIDQAVTALDGLVWVATPSRGSGCLHISSSRSNTLASSRGAWLHLDVDPRGWRLFDRAGDALPPSKPRAALPELKLP